MRPYAFKRPGSLKPKTTRETPEAHLQSAVVKFLNLALPSDIFWWPSFAGGRRSMRAQADAKAMGMRRGEPDLKFVLPDDRTVWIELKSDVGVLTVEQKAFGRAHPKVFAVCRTVNDVAAALTGWGVTLRAMPW